MIYRIDRKHLGRVVPAIAGGLLLATAALAPACKGVVVQTIEPIPPPTIGEIGDPCRINDENSPEFVGFGVTEEWIDNRSKACNSGICLINHVQGSADCPLGQSAPTYCAGPGDASCKGGASCVAAGFVGNWCYYTPVDGGAAELNASLCESGVCNSPQNTCQCTSDAQCPQFTACDPVTQECTQYVCHTAGECQTPDATDAENAGKGCCAGDSDVPLQGEVCGQCQKGSGRNAAEDIYCSCRCGLADGAPPDGGDLCACPFGFECSLIRADAAISDVDHLAGKYCIKQGTAYTDPDQCGSVSGHFSPYKCDGTPAN